MESLDTFEWLRDSAGYRLAWMPERGGKAYWTKEGEVDWSKTYAVDRRFPLSISATEYAGEKRLAKSGIYIVGQRQWLNKGSPDEIWQPEVVRPFRSDKVLSLNLIRRVNSLKDYLVFTNENGFIGHGGLLSDLLACGRDKRPFIAHVEHEDGWHYLKNVLSKIYEYYPAIRDRDTSLLSESICWDSDDVVREDRGYRLGRTKIKPAIAIRGTLNTAYFDFMKRPDVLVPAAFAITDSVNRYLEKALSLEISFDPQSLQFKSSLRYGSLGAALIAEAVEFVAGRLEAKACNVCGSWFRVGESHKRKDRIFCSAACKMRDYRSRKSAALQS